MSPSLWWSSRPVSTLPRYGRVLLFLHFGVELFFRLQSCRFRGESVLSGRGEPKVSYNVKGIHTADLFFPAALASFIVLSNRRIPVSSVRRKILLLLWSLSRSVFSVRSTPDRPRPYSQSIQAAACTWMLVSVPGKYIRNGRTAEDTADYIAGFCVAGQLAVVIENAMVRIWSAITRMAISFWLSWP